MSEEETAMQAPLSGGRKKKILVLIAVAAILLGISVVIILLLTSNEKEDVTDIHVLLDDISIVEETDTEEELIDEVPFVYSSFQEFAKIHTYIVDRKTGMETLLEGVGSTKMVYAVPQVGFDGRIFLNLSATDGPIPSVRPFSFDLNDDNVELELVPFAENLPFAASAVSLSPDQTKLVAAYDNIVNDPDDFTYKSLVIWNLLTGERTEVATVSEDEYLAGETGPNTFGGSQLFDIGWVDLDCIRYSVFTDVEDAEDTDQKRFVDTRTACSYEQGPK